MVPFQRFNATEARTWLAGERPAGPQTLAEVYAAKAGERTIGVAAIYGQYL